MWPGSPPRGPIRPIRPIWPPVGPRYASGEGKQGCGRDDEDMHFDNKAVKSVVYSERFSMPDNFLRPSVRPSITSSVTSYLSCEQ